MLDRVGVDAWKIASGEISNPDNERLDSLTTQFVVAYQIHPRLRLQVNVPVIRNNFV